MSTAGKLIPQVVAKTADYTITASDWGKIFTNRGDADAIIFTLPAVSAVQSGFYVEFFIVADFSFTVAATAGEIVTFNDAAANSVTFATAGEIMGSGLKAVCDGTSWLLFINLAKEAVTHTIAT